MYVVYIENPQNRAQRKAVVNTIMDCRVLRIKKPPVSKRSDRQSVCKVSSCNALLRVPLVCIRSYLKLFMRY